MDFNTIDWNAMWQAESSPSHWGKNNCSRKDLWDRRAAGFNKRISRVAEGKEDLDKDDYISKMLDRIEVQSDWSVLDIGCGPGTLAVPLAKKSKSVTALDLSSEMLKYLKENAEKNGLSNIQYINSSWNDACTNHLISPHDVVVASRSLMSGDIKEALSHIISITRQAAYLTFPIVHLPFDWEIYKVIGRNGKKHPPYIYICNMLYQMGIQANMEVLHSRIKVQFSSIEQAIDDVQWRTETFNPKELALLTEFLERKFSELKGSSVLTHEGYSKWALVWWRKGQNYE